MDSYETIKGYDVEVFRDGNRILADIKYPCGELVMGFETDSYTKGKILTNSWLINNPENLGHVGCEDEWCVGV